MNKYLTGAALATVLAFAGAAEAKHDGFFTGAKVGYSHTSGKIKTQPATYNGVPVKLNGANKGKSGFNGVIFVGHGVTFGKGHFAAVLNASYDSAKVDVGDVTTVAGNNLGNFYFKPQFGLGLESRLGMHFGEGNKYLVFMKLGVDYNFAKAEFKSSVVQNEKDNMGMWSVTPGLGVQGEINDHLNWTAGVDYKIAFSIKKANISKLMNKKPRSFVVNAGLTYHF